MTEKNYNPNQKENKAMKKQKALQPKSETKVPVKEEKAEEKKEIKKAEQPKVKKSEAVVKGISLPLSTKTSRDICKFIKGKNIQKAIAELGQIAIKKKALPMKGELPHRKGKIMSGGYPKKASEYFIGLLKSLQGNANANGLSEPIITEAFANIASRPYGGHGRVRKKRSHGIIKARQGTSSLPQTSQRRHLREKK